MQISVPLVAQRPTASGIRGEDGQGRAVQGHLAAGGWRYAGGDKSWIGWPASPATCSTCSVPSPALPSSSGEYPQNQRNASEGDIPRSHAKGAGRALNRSGGQAAPPFRGSTAPESSDGRRVSPGHGASAPKLPMVVRLQASIFAKREAPCVYRKLKLGRSGGEVRQGWRVI